MSYAGYLAAPERRRRILDSAKRVFARRGYHDTNISHICESLGIARGTLYQYFTSKKDVFAAIVEEMLERVREAVAREPVVDIPAGIARRARRWWPSPRAACNVSSRRSSPTRPACAFSCARRWASMWASTHPRIDALVVDRFAGDLAVGLRAGVLRADVDPRAAALFVLGGIQKVALDALAHERTIDLGVLALEVTRMNMMGLLAEEVT